MHILISKHHSVHRRSVCLRQLRRTIFLLTLAATVIHSNPVCGQTSSLGKTVRPQSSNPKAQIIKVRPKPSAQDLGRNSSELKLALRPLSEKLGKSIVRFAREHRAPTLGTVVTQDGLVIAKLSELEQPLTCELPDGRRASGTITARDRQLDLALVKIEAQPLVPIEFQVQTSAPALGDILVSLAYNGEVIGVGVVSTRLEGLPLQQDPKFNRIRMGISVAPSVESKTVMVNRKYLQKLGLRIQQVEPRSVGEAGNLIVNDLVCSINGKAVSSVESWNAAMSGISVGQQIRFEVIRNDKLMVTPPAEAKSDSHRTIHDLWGGGPFNERRFDFGPVIVHDTKIRPEDCGGPLVDLDGNCVGINIARSLRVASFAIPSQRVLQWIQTVQPDASLMLK